MSCNECEHNNTERNDLPENVPYIVYEAERARSERLFKRMWIAIIVAVALIFASNAVWLWAWTSYDYVSYEYSQDGEGTNIIGDDNEVNNGAETQNKGEKEENTGNQETENQNP